MAGVHEFDHDRPPPLVASQRGGIDRVVGAHTELAPTEDRLICPVAAAARTHIECGGSIAQRARGGRAFHRVQVSLCDRLHVTDMGGAKQHTFGGRGGACGIEVIEGEEGPWQHDRLAVQRERIMPHKCVPELHVCHFMAPRPRLTYSTRCEQVDCTIIPVGAALTLAFDAIQVGVARPILGRVGDAQIDLQAVHVRHVLDVHAALAYVLGRSGTTGA